MPTAQGTADIDGSGDDEYSPPRRLRPPARTRTHKLVDAPARHCRNASNRDAQALLVDGAALIVSGKRSRTSVSQYTDAGANTRRPKVDTPLLPQPPPDNRSAREKNSSHYNRLVDRRASNASRAEKRQEARDLFVD